MCESEAKQTSTTCVCVRHTLTHTNLTGCFTLPLSIQHVLEAAGSDNTTHSVITNDHGPERLHQHTRKESNLFLNHFPVSLCFFPFSSLPLKISLSRKGFLWRRYVLETNYTNHPPPVKSAACCYVLTYGRYRLNNTWRNMRIYVLQQPWSV